jgi:hypothetical protein
MFGGRFTVTRVMAIIPAPELLIIAHARDQRVIPGIATEVLISAVPALQAIGIVAATKGLRTAPARDQRVIPRFAIEELTIAVAGYQKIIARCARHEQDFLQNELVAAKARLLCWARKVKNQLQAPARTSTPFPELPHCGVI